MPNCGYVGRIADFSTQSLGDRTMFEAHFQTFEEPESGVALTARLAAFREELARRKLSGFVIPRADQQQNEYVAPSSAIDAPACASAVSFGVSASGSSTSADCSRWSRALLESLR